MAERYTANGKRRSSMTHAKRGYYCSCGRVVHGNGAKASHRAMHDRKGDGHRYVSRERWLADTDAGREWAAAYERQKIEIDAITAALAGVSTGMCLIPTLLMVCEHCLAGTGGRCMTGGCAFVGKIMDAPVIPARDARSMIEAGAAVLDVDAEDADCLVHAESVLRAAGAIGNER